MGWVVNATPPDALLPDKDTIRIVEGAGWATGPIWTDEENLVPTGIRSPDRRHTDFAIPAHELPHILRNPSFSI